MRNKTLDVVKGLGILLVVLAHAIGKNDVDALLLFNNGLFNVVASFYMPMFMMVSGYLVYNKIGNWAWAKKHITKWIPTLLIFPIIYWVVAHYFPAITDFFGLYNVGFASYITHITLSGFSGLALWYLWTTIICYLICYLLEQSRLKIKLPFILQIITFALVINIIPFNQFGFFTVKWYGMFFLIGYALHHYSMKKKLAYISLLAFPLCTYLFNWMIPYQDSEYGCFGLSVIIPAITNGHAYLVGVMFLMAILGTGFVYSIAMLVRWKPFVLLFGYLGSISIGIYLLHIMFVGIVHNYWLAALIATCISIGLYEVLKRSKIIDFLLFGGDIPIKLKKLGGWYGKAEA